jgi:hypothetical protein
MRKELRPWRARLAALIARGALSPEVDAIAHNILYGLDAMQIGSKPQPKIIEFLLQDITKLEYHLQAKRQSGSRLLSHQ